MLAVLLVLAQVSSGSPAGGPPRECAPLGSRLAGNVWERAKSPALRKYCDLLAAAAARLAAGSGEEDARFALALADEAAGVLADRATSDVLRGRALGRLHRWGEAEAALARARSRDPRALEEPSALFTWARASARAGNAAEAAEAFRTLLPRVATLPLEERGMAEVEAGLLAAARGAGGIDEAVAVLREARKDAQDAVQGLATLALALALDRAGEGEESRLTLAASPPGDPRAIVGDARAQEVLTDARAEAERDALVAIGLERSDPEGARAVWGKYLAGAGGKGPWADEARAHERRRGRGAP